MIRLNYVFWMILEGDLNIENIIAVVLNLMLIETKWSLHWNQNQYIINRIREVMENSTLVEETSNSSLDTLEKELFSTIGTIRI